MSGTSCASASAASEWAAARVEPPHGLSRRTGEPLGGAKPSEGPRRRTGQADASAATPPGSAWLDPRRFVFANSGAAALLPRAMRVAGIRTGWTSAPGIRIPPTGITRRKGKARRKSANTKPPTRNRHPRTGTAERDGEVATRDLADVANPEYEARQRGRRRQPRRALAPRRSGGKRDLASGRDEAVVLFAVADRQPDAVVERVAAREGPRDEASLE